MADILISIISAVGFGLTALYVAVARRHKPTWKAGVIMLLACAELTSAHVLQSISSDVATKVFWYKMIYFGFTITPTAFLCLGMLSAQTVRIARVGPKKECSGTFEIKQKSTLTPK